jgi:hypothetical protein
VGATIVSIAAGLGNVRLPAVGISTDELCDVEDAETPEDAAQCAADNAAHFANVAGFIGRLVDRLQDKPGRSNSFDGLLAPGVALSVNYPPLSPEEIRGVQVVEQGRDLVLSGAVVGLTSGCFGDCSALAAGESLLGGINGLFPAEPLDSEGNDTVGFIGGYITILPIEADYTAGPENLRSTKSIVRGLGAQ